MKHLLSIVLCVSLPTVLLSSCNSDEPVINQPNNAEVLTHKVSLQDALDRSKVFWDGMTSEKPSTRSRSFADIESVEYISSSPRTRSGATDTIFYLVNYRNEEGFMLLSADDRMLPVYAMSDEGRLDLNDTIFNEGLRMFYNNAKSDALRLPPYQPDTTIQIVVDPFDYKYDRTVKPKFSKNLRSVQQSSPFNKYCFTKKGEQALVGCGPLAVGSVLAYYKMPLAIEGRALNWHQINANIQHDDFYYLLAQLGKDKYMAADYGVTSTSCSYYKISTIFEQFGFEHAPLVDFNDKQAAMALEEHPIVVYGKREPKGAHLWVMDGYIRYGYTHNINLGPEPGRLLPYFYFHCCWGWNRANGYFYYNSDGFLDVDNVIYNEDEVKSYSSYKYGSLKMIVNFNKK